MSGFLTLAYTFIGDPPGTNLRDSFAGSIGAAYAVARPFSLFAFLDGATRSRRAGRSRGAARRRRGPAGQVPEADGIGMKGFTDVRRIGAPRGPRPSLLTC